MLSLVIRKEELKLDSVRAKMEIVSHANSQEQLTSIWIFVLFMAVGFVFNYEEKEQNEKINLNNACRTRGVSPGSPDEQSQQDMCVYIQTDLFQGMSS